MNKETIDLKLLRYFVEAARLLNFTAASDSLHVPKSALSKGIAKLESQIGEKLFERSSRVVSLTDTGNILYLRASHLLDESQLLLADLKSLRKQVAGKITLGAPPILGRYLSRHILPAFMQQWPEVNVVLKLSYEFENLFAEGIDVAFRMGANRHDTLIERPLGWANRVIVAAPFYLQRSAAIESPQDLLAHQSVQFSEQQFASPWTLQKGSVTEQVDVPVTFRCADLGAVASAAIGGVGVAQLPWLLVREAVRQGELIHVLPAWQSPQLPIALVYRQGHNKSARLKEFLQWVEDNKAQFDLRYSASSP